MQHPSRRTLVVLAVVVSLVACAAPTEPATPDPAPSVGFASPASAPTSSPSGPPGASSATPPTASAASSPVPSASVAVQHPNLAGLRLALEPVAAGLASPLFVTSAHDGSGRLFVLEQAGRVRLIRGGALAPDPYLDLSRQVESGGERGLLGLAFAPGFGQGEDRLYVHYSNLHGDTTIAELRATPGSDRVEATSERIVLVVPQPYPNHNGGWIGFDQAGRLLVGLGDGGDAGDPGNRASNLASLLGKILRLDVLAGPSGGLAYAIPADNPFVGRTGARPEVLDFGLRNPYRDSIDPATGTLWIGDVGQNLWEEVDAAPVGSAGLDFGWRRWEGRHCYNPSTGCDPAGVTMPVAEYGHDQGCAIVGGVVYRGKAIAALDGAYLFGDYCSGRLWAIDASGGDQQPRLVLETGLAISAIGTDDAGEVYLTDLRGGTVVRLVAAG